MKKSMLNVITLALVLINLVLTVVLTFSLVSTNKKTNNLITKVAEIIDLDVGGITTSSGTTSTGVISDGDIEYVDVVSGDNDSLTISYTNNGKTHYAVLKVSLGLNTKAKDYATKKTSVENGMKVIVSTITKEAQKYSYDEIEKNMTNIESDLLSALQDQFQTECIYSVTIYSVVTQ
jgi:flagellar FliL protein